MKLEFDRFLKNTQIPEFIKIRLVGVDLFYADIKTDGQTDKHEKVNCRVLQFCKRALTKKINTQHTSLVFYVNQTAD